jgi:hypothetical protein
MVVIDIGSVCNVTGLTLDVTEPSADVGAVNNYLTHGSYPAGATVTYGWSGISCTGITLPEHVFFQAFDEHDTLLDQIFPGCGTGPVTRSFALPVFTNTMSFDLGVSLNIGTVKMQGFHLIVTPCAQPCQYGTQPQAGVAAVSKITDSLLTSWLSPGLEWLAPVFAPLIGFDLVTTDLCSRPPPVVAPIDLSTLNATYATVLNILQVVAWPKLCQCVVGTPSPSSPPPFAPVEPTGWPPVVTFGCDPANICAALVEIQRSMFRLQTVLGENLQLTTLVQRYQLPFAFIPGTTHGPLTGQGSFNVSRLLGLEVTVLARPPGRVTPDVPPYIWDLGWMSVTDGDAMLQERRVNRDNFTWLPPSMALTSSVGYSLNTGVSVDIQELKAEP